MMADQIRDRISEICSHFTFDYLGMTCGVDPLSQVCFEMWYGEKIETFRSLDEVMNTPFFDGKTLAEIADEIEIVDW